MIIGLLSADQLEDAVELWVQTGFCGVTAGHSEPMDEFDLTERLITATEFASMLGVTEDDVLEWLLAGHIPYVEGPDGEPQVRIAEEHSGDGPISSGLIIYSISDDPGVRAELARRRREHELGLSTGVTSTSRRSPTRLRPGSERSSRQRSGSSPRGPRRSSRRRRPWNRDRHAFHASFPEGGSGADRVRAAAAMEAAQDELTMVTTSGLR